MIKSYRKRPIIVEALQYTGENALALWEFAGKSLIRGYASSQPIIKTLEGNLTVSVGDYVIKGVLGEFYPCKPKIFEETYEEVETND